MCDKFDCLILAFQCAVYCSGSRKLDDDSVHSAHPAAQLC